MALLTELAPNDLACEACGTLMRARTPGAYTPGWQSIGRSAHILAFTEERASSKNTEIIHTRALCAACTPTPVSTGMHPDSWNPYT